MNQLTQFLVDGILHEAESEVVTAVFGGGFKPPTQGHLEVVLRAIKENPEIDQVYIVVGSGVRNGISQEQSMKIWEKYKPLIPKTTEIIEAGSPLNWIKDYLKDHTEDKTYILIGAREGNEEDEKDLEQRSNLFKKYGGEIKPIFTQGNISGTNARAAAKQSKEAFYPFLPDQLSDSDKEEIYNIILPTLNEVGEGNSKPYEWVEHFGEYFFTTDSNVKYIVSLDEISEGNKDGISIEFSAKTTEMGGYSSKIEVSKGELFRVMATIINILKTYISKDPKVEFILYSPHKKTGEGDINNQRDKLYKAFIKNQLPGAKIKDIGTSTIIVYLPNNSETNDLGETSDPQAGTALPYGSGFAPIKENASYSKDIDVKGKILELTKHMLAKGMNIKPLPKVIFKNGDSSNARDFYGKTAYYNPNDQTITLYTEGRHPKDIVRSFSHEMIHHIQNLENRLGDVSTTNTMEDDNIDKLEQEANLKGTMTFRNWTDSLNERFD
jgi:phosphopantetheine adenylyltransferase